MKAVIVKTYGGPEVAQVMDVPEPVIVNPKQLRIKVMATGVNSGDARIRRADPWFVRLAFGLTGPRNPVLGMAFAGVVEEVGSEAAQYHVGDRVYGMSEEIMGAHAEHLVVNDTTPMGVMPEMMSFVDAAALPFGATTALHFLEGLDVNNKTVCINGASGAVGICFLQIAKERGAVVTAITSTDNITLMTELGADIVIDYTKTDVSSLATEYDVFIDCVNVIPVSRVDSLVRRGGVAILLSGLIKEMVQSLFIRKCQVRIGPARVTSEQFTATSSLYSTGGLKPVIDKVFTIDAIVEAYTLVDSKKKVGSVVLKVHE
jgi:NADPH:quinone reductase-like Zn-dependent oxidoreductase